MSVSLLPTLVETDKASPFTLFRKAGPCAKVRVSQNKTAGRTPVAFDKLHCIENAECDRMAIFDAQLGCYHIFSTEEAVSRSGLTKKEAEEWVAGRLYMVGEKMNVRRLMELSLLVAGSWGVVILGAWGVFKLFV
ncbi:MAG: hypothetical protein AB8G77_10245 [Rhodothermales bacterium]